MVATFNANARAAGMEITPGVPAAMRKARKR